MRKEKSFSNFRANGFHLNFPNGNSISTIWGYGAYCENHFKDMGSDDVIGELTKFVPSEDCEVMVLNCSDRLLKRLKKKFDADNPFGYLSISDWLYIVNAVAKDDLSSSKVKE